MIPLLALGGALLLMNPPKRRKRRRRNPPPWTKAEAAHVRRTFRSSASYTLLDTLGSGGTWLAGGCWIAAAAIQKVFGGGLVAVVARDLVQHVVVEKGGLYMDADGKPLAAAPFLTRYARLEGLPSPTFSPLRPAEVRGIPFNETAVSETAALLLKPGAKRNPLPAFLRRMMPQGSAALITAAANDLRRKYGGQALGWARDYVSTSKSSTKRAFWEKVAAHLRNQLVAGVNPRRKRLKQRTRRR